MSEFTRTPWRLTKFGDILDKDNCMLFANCKGLAMMKDARLMQNAPEMYELLIFCLKEAENGHLMDPEQIKKLLARIDGEEADND